MSVGERPIGRQDESHATTQTFQFGVGETSPLTRPPTLRPGATFGHYRLARLLGCGGMGEVYEAADLHSGRHVALKTSRRALENESDRARFLREGRLAASISHPNVVYVFGSEEIDGIPVIVTELVRGGTLRDQVDRHGPLPPAEAVDAMLQVIAGLEAVAAEGVLHRDVKPSNCFIDRDGRIKIGDFGLAISTLARDETQVTRDGGIVGTLAFASPEQLRGEPLDVRSDIYSAGATLYYLLAGRQPFADRQSVRLIARVLEEPPPALRTVRRDVPRSLDKIILHCLAKGPADRPESYARLSKLLVPYGSAMPAPATLGLRALAGLVDALIMRVLGGSLPMLAVLQWQQRVPDSTLEVLVWTAPHFALIIGYFGISEGLWSASPGKRLVGLRVVGSGSQPLGLTRSFARALLWSLAPMPAFIAWLALVPLELNAAASRTGLLAYLALQAATLSGFGVLFSTARRRNGFAALHDLATDTRVVSKVALEQKSTRQAAMEPRPVVAPTAARVGPYVILDESGGPGVQIGFDEPLARRVWIRRVLPGTPAVSPARQRVSRPTRLRWLTGERNANHSWDAYEAVEGEPLRDANRRPRTWATVRQWLRNLAEEISTARKDDTQTTFAFERVWITDGRAKVLDWEPDGREELADVPLSGDNSGANPTQHFLYNTAVRGLGIQNPHSTRPDGPSTLPLHARDFLCDLAARRFDTVEQIVERLQTLASRPATVTRARRCAHLAICGAAPLLFVLLAVPAWVVLMTLLARSPDAFVLEACLERLQQLEHSTTSDGARERAAVETYMVGHFRPLLTAQPPARKPWFWVLIEVRRPIVEGALERNPSPSDAEVARAAQRLAGLVAGAQRDRERAARGLLGWRQMFFILLLLVVVSAVAGVLSSFIARGGHVLRLLGIAAVGPDGREVSGLRGFARGLIAWAPGIAAFVLLLAFTARGPLDDLSIGQLVPSLILLAVFVAGAVFSLVNPHRGLQDRMVRTILVAR